MRNYLHNYLVDVVDTVICICDSAADPAPTAPVFPLGELFSATEWMEHSNGNVCFTQVLYQQCT
jgi:hypothetical protein